MNMKQQIVEKVSSFPTLPTMAGRLLNLLNDPDIPASEIGKVIQYDPALTANLMKAANSVYLGVSQEVASVAEALFRLGSKWVFQIAVSSLIYSNLNRPVTGYELSGKDLWRHSIAVGLMADILCKELKVRDVGLIFTAGLLHDMGKIIMGEFISESIEEIERQVSEEDIPFEEAERRILGVDHAEIGALIAARWKFPPVLVAAIRWHHNPDGVDEPSEVVDIVHIADALCLMQGYGIGRDGIHYRPNRNATDRLKVAGHHVELATSQLVTALDEVDTLFSEIPASVAVGRS